MKPYSSKHLSASKGNLPKSGKKTNKTRNQFKRYFKKSFRQKSKMYLLQLNMYDYSIETIYL